jgi:hypothetical protein
LASWENEGGAITPPKRKPETTEAPQHLVASVIELAPIAVHRADRGMGDTHSLKVLEVSLLLLVPVLAGIAIFWAAASAPQ